MAELMVPISAAEAVSLGSGNAIREEALKRAKVQSAVLFEKDPLKAQLVIQSLRHKLTVAVGGGFEVTYEIPEFPEPAPTTFFDDLEEKR